MSVATPHSIGRTSRISAISESPGSAPFTATGPVALLMRDMSIPVTRSSSLRIWPVKQSFVSNVTTSPGSTSSTGWRSGPNDQITWSRDREYCGMNRLFRFVFDVDTIEVGETLGLERHDERGEHDPDHRVGERDPVRILERIGRRGLVELEVEREEEQHDPAERQKQMQERVELASSLPEGVRDAAD